MRSLLLLLLGAVVLVRPAWAQGDQLTGTLRKVHDTGAITLGYRESSVPFSFRDRGGQPVGYSIDLCLEVVKDVAAELGVPSVQVRYELVTPENRVSMLQSGRIDLECGSTTSSRTRQREVSFSPIIFVAGTKLLVNRSSNVASLRDLRGKTVVVTAGTTNETAIRALDAKEKLGLNIMVTPDHAQSYARLAAGAADAFATDDVLLYGFIATEPNGSMFKVVGDYLSYEPYGLMYRRDDPAMADIVAGTFRRLADEGEFARLYNHWFQSKLPGGQVLGIPISPQLAEVFDLLSEHAAEP
jgi:glutamate/aspartate transport system substrate-binding protein